MATEEASKKVGEEEEEEQLPVQEFMFYLKPENTYTIIEKEWVKFTLLTAVIYCIHLFWMCYGVDAYSSYERHTQCTGATTKDDASGVYDTWILLTIIFHMVEWIRQTIFATSALVGVNLVAVYYGLFIFVPYGLIVMLGAGIAAGSSESDCQENQPARSTYLLLQLLAFFLTLITCCAHVIFFKIMGVEWLHEVLYREDDDEDD